MQNVNYIRAKGIDRDSGFTLLEVLVALAILSIALSLIIQLYSANLQSVSISGNMSSAVAWSDAKIREILADPSLTEKAWREITDDGYRIEVSIGEVLKERTDNLPVKMMEVTLVVRWNEGRKERNIQLKTVKMIDKIKPAESSSPSIV
ncbi:MAG: prepilin-type N-terminal cleavage/methylation domain-containing protein [Deltaproteobacteria bacterium]|nr:prepilin-type N-terminal cleavage/methylation domain-containing protein [Deltaproteobacteria bacterium]